MGPCSYPIAPLGSFAYFYSLNFSSLTDRRFIELALAEDIGHGDHSTLGSIPPEARGKAVLWAKEVGVLAGVDLAEKIFRHLEPEASITAFKSDGDCILVGDQILSIEARIHTILQAERLVLNCMQRMSGIASLTAQMVALLQGYNTRILDTRKTTPLFRAYEKQAVVLGGGMNHRMGLYDMVMLKDNHIDYCGGIRQAIRSVRAYLDRQKLNLKVEVETRNLNDVQEVLAEGGVDRIMLDNFDPATLKTAVDLIDGRFETEASGGITMDNILAYARTGVDYISSGSVIHHAASLDLSLKAAFH